MQKYNFWKETDKTDPQKFKDFGKKPTKTDKNDPHGFKDFGKKLGYTIWSINGVPSVLQKENLEDKNSCSSYDYMEESIF